ncbi:MAG: transposase [Syntrophobacter sp.]
MARPLRIVYDGAFYHVTARGNEKRDIFLSRADYEKFLAYLAESARKYAVILHAFTLMSNHYHLIVETPNANLSAFVHTVNSAYTTYFNLKRKRVGHLFQGRFKSILIDKDNYLLELSRYIHLNPVRAGIVAKPLDYPYSSYSSYAFPNEDAIVSRELIWAMIAGNAGEASVRYASFVESAIQDAPPNPFKKVHGGAILGSETFIRSALQMVPGSLDKDEIAQRKTLSSRASGIEDIIRVLALHYGVPAERIVNSSPYRSYAIYFARKDTPVSGAEIGRYFGITCSAITKIGTRMRQRMEKNNALREEMNRIEDNLSAVNG